jgi:hypothetical protein
MVVIYGAGCLCEEMGLGKTIEVLACVLTHRNPTPAAPQPVLRRVEALPKEPRIECNACGTSAADPEDPRAQNHVGLWLECSGCHAWMHGSCIGVHRDEQVPDTLLCAGCMRDLCCQTVAGVSKATLIVCPEAIQKQVCSGNLVSGHITTVYACCVVHCAYNTANALRKAPCSGNGTLYRSLHADEGVPCFAWVHACVPASTSAG